VVYKKKYKNKFIFFFFAESCFGAEGLFFKKNILLLFDVNNYE
jgi:hypothetical protein